MVTREQLTARGMRAYELGRLRSASRAALYLIPVVALCAVVTNAVETCVCLGVVLLAASVWLRWRDRRGGDSANTGLVAGSIPLLAGLIAVYAIPDCADPEYFILCAAVSLSAGAASGIWLGLRIGRQQSGLVSGAFAAGIAILAASLGCIGLGVAGVVGAGVGILLGGAGAVAVARPTP